MKNKAKNKINFCLKSIIVLCFSFIIICLSCSNYETVTNDPFEQILVATIYPKDLQMDSVENELVVGATPTDESGSEKSAESPFCNDKPNAASETPIMPAPFVFEDAGNIAIPNKNKDKIDVYTLILTELDRSVSMKIDLETKIIGYITIITLALTLLFQYIAVIEKLKIRKLFKTILKDFYCIQFLLGIILLIFCALSIFPKPLSYFNAQALLEKSIDMRLDKVTIIQSAMSYITKNNAVIHTLEGYSYRISQGLIGLIFMFSFGSVVFFSVVAKKRHSVDANV